MTFSTTAFDIMTLGVKMHKDVQYENYTELEDMTINWCQFLQH